MVLSIVKELAKTSKCYLHVFCIFNSPFHILISRLKNTRKSYNHLIYVDHSLTFFSFVKKLFCFFFWKKNVIFILSQSYLSDNLFILLLLRVFLNVKIYCYVPIIENFQILDPRFGFLKELFFWNICFFSAHGYIVLTNSQMVFLRNKGFCKKIFVLPNTVLNWPRKYLFKTTLSSNANSFDKVLFLGRFDPHQKGLDILFDYLIKHANYLKDFFSFTFVGSGTYIYKRIENSEVLKDSKLKGFIKVKRWSKSWLELKKHDALILPSRFEGLPLVMLEAFIAGRPVIGTKIKGIKDFVPNSCLFKVGDFQSCINILFSLKNNLYFRNFVVRNNLKTYMHSCSNAVFARKVNSLLKINK